MMLLRRLACAAIACLTCAVASAQTPAPTPQRPRPPAEFPDVDELNLADLLDVTVSIAAGRVQRLEEAPSIVSVITDEDIRRMGAQTLQEVLATIPGFEVLTDNMGRSRIAVRGAASQLGTSENVLILFNGHRLNDHIYGGATVANLDIPVYNLRQIEVIRGPGSALFGTNAFTAVINLVSYTSQNFEGVEVSAGGGSFGTQQYSALVARTVGSLGLSASFQVRDTDGPELLLPADAQTPADRALAPFGIRPASLAPGTTKDDRRTIDFTANGAYKGFSFSSRVSDIRSGGFIGRVDILGRGNELGTRHMSVDAAQKFGLGRRGSLTANVSFAQTKVREDLNALPPGFTRVLPDFTIFSFRDGVLVDFANNSRRAGAGVAFDYRVAPDHQLTLGTGVEHEATFDLRASGNFDIFTGGPLPAFQPLPFTILAPSDRTIVSAYAQDTWNVAPALGLTAGVRYDHYNDFGNTVNPRAALVWRLPSNLHVKALYGRAFRAPTFAELSVNLPGAITGNPALRPPTINTVEFALGYRARNLRMTANYFANFIRDFITSTKPISVQGVIGSLTYVNTEGLNVQGFELEVRRTVGLAHAFFANYTYQHQQERERGIQLPDLPSHLASAGGTAGFGSYLSVTPTLLVRSERPRLSVDPRPRVGPYGLLNLNLRAKNLFDTFEISATVNNLFDRRYFDPSPFATLPGDYPRAGRSVFVNASYKF